MNPTYVIKTNRYLDVHYRATSINEAIARYYHDWGINLPDIDKGDWQYDAATQTYTYAQGEAMIEVMGA